MKTLLKIFSKILDLGKVISKILFYSFFPSDSSCTVQWHNVHFYSKKMRLRVDETRDNKITIYGVKMWQYPHVVPCEAQIQEKLCKNHTKSYYIPVTHSAKLI